MNTELKKEIKNIVYNIRYVLFYDNYHGWSGESMKPVLSKLEELLLKLRENIY